tara:strand:+ start:285 stop:563 length:279 start_codon:yes stop_codon:yes gene_type:complete
METLVKLKNVIYIFIIITLLQSCYSKRIEVEDIDIYSKKADVVGICYYKTAKRNWHLVYYKSIVCDFDSIGKVKEAIAKEMDSATLVHKKYK